MAHSNFIILFLFFFGITSCAQNVPPVKSETPSLLAFVSEGNQIKMWNAATNETKIIADLNDEIRINRISFTDSNTINYSVYHRQLNLAILK